MNLNFIQLNFLSFNVNFKQNNPKKIIPFLKQTFKNQKNQ